VRWHVLLTLLLSGAPCLAPAAPYVPSSDQQVLERLPFKATDPLARELAQLREAVRRNNKDLDAAVRLARRYYGLVGEEGDPRYLGYAQAALAPWWNQPQPPVPVQLLRASIRQFRHDFTGALTDLATVLEREPSNAEARTLRALIHIVQARYADGRRDCVSLVQYSPLIGAGCAAMVDGLTGEQQPAYRRLADILARHPKVPDSDRLWVHVRLAELAERMSDAKLTEHHYRQALATGIQDGFMLAAYADFLLDRQRPREVVKLLEQRTRSDVLLLRLAFAERALGMSEADAHEKELAARFQAATMRGDNVHQQEESRFALAVEKNPANALMLARENWRVQREPRDARAFLEAAVAARDSAAAAPVLEWLVSSRIADSRLSELASRLTEREK